MSIEGDFIISTDKSLMDIAMIHQYLSTESYWAKNIPLAIVERSINNSLNFGVFHQEKQIAYARIITDYSTIAYLGDVFVLSDFRGKGISKWLIKEITAHPPLQGLRRWILLTADAHGLYKKYGWESILQPEKWMEKVRVNPYNTASDNQ
ncbi:GNAT family N-acetyltransferase [Olivibacter domesticus]|uniref:Acetyltransferase (GNAT) domain-containing protein n=1 Tax=Olivibacter domesticus TaxID=407022 RepID=A0A1H7TSM6_OLID1|nr:GNAT family N-acetyltransferase [Olivibacter domesticus]SEL86867.1 Acetyltransferase (GNAT) domain-containing protein [Olivibacter domesticus]